MTELLVFDDFLLIDGTGRAPMPGARVVIEEGVIVSVGGASVLAGVRRLAPANSIALGNARSQGRREGMEDRRHWRHERGSSSSCRAWM